MRDKSGMGSKQKMLQSEHDRNNAFVKAQQAKMVSKAGKAPSLDAECMNFDACMTNTGDKAQSFAKTLTAGIDDAFPVK